MGRGLPYLPFEIVFDILSRLPVKSLCRFKSVSKPWLALITHPDFIKSHLNHSLKHRTNQKLIIDPHPEDRSFISFYSIDCQTPDDTVAQLEMPGKYVGRRVEICGSFNGVILLDIEDGLCLWNPSIRRHRKFSQPAHLESHDFGMYMLGYDYVSDDFKVVAVYFLPSPDDNVVVYVYSSKLSSWKRIGAFRDDIFIDATRCILNGSPHWLVCEDTNISLGVIYFDVTEEIIKELPMPFENGRRSTLTVLGGWLCVFDEHPKGRCDVWVMKEYGVKESWTKLFDIPNLPGGEFFFNFVELLCLTKGGEVIIIMNLNDDKLVIYDPKQNAYKYIGIPFVDKYIVATPYVESLVSPHGCNDTRR